MTYSVYCIHQPSGEYRDVRTDAINLSDQIHHLQNEGCLILSVLYIENG